MTENLLMTPTEVIDYAFATGEYVSLTSLTESMIAAAQLRYITPILGSELTEAVADGKYEELREGYIAPTLGLLVRLEANLAAYPPTVTERQRAKLFLSTLSDYLNTNADEFSQYAMEDNVMNRCSIVAGFVI